MKEQNAYFMHDEVPVSIKLRNGQIYIHRGDVLIGWDEGQTEDDFDRLVRYAEKKKYWKRAGLI